MSSDLSIWMRKPPERTVSPWVRVHRYTDDLLPPDVLPDMVDDECRNLPASDRAQLLEAALHHGVAHVSVGWGVQLAGRNEAFDAAVELARETDGFVVATSNGWKPLEQMHAYRPDELVEMRVAKAS